MEPWNREIRVWSFPSALKFERHLGSSATEMPVQFQNDLSIITCNLAASRHRDLAVRRLFAWWVMAQIANTRLIIGRGLSQDFLYCKFVLPKYSDVSRDRVNHLKKIWLLINNNIESTKAESTKDRMKFKGLFLAVGTISAYSVNSESNFKILLIVIQYFRNIQGCFNSYSK